MSDVFQIRGGKFSKHEKGLPRLPWLTEEATASILLKKEGVHVEVNI